jgi:RhtB (resistance to homoserine/threonine) family protein
MSEFLYIFLIWLVGLISPGPDFVMVMNQSVTKGRKAGLFTALGFGSGILLHCTYCILGIGILISQSILLFDIIKTVGGLYLIYLGVKSFLHKDEPELNKILRSTEDSNESVLKSFRIGFLTDALNPKTTVLILSLFTQIVDAHTSIFIQITYSLAFAVSTSLWHSCVSFMFSTEFIKQKYDQFKGVVTKTFGVLLVFFGLKVITLNK